MFAILTEHYAQKWPLWLSPRQVMIVPISVAAVEYARQVRARLRAARFHVEVDERDNKMQKKVFPHTRVLFLTVTLLTIAPSCVLCSFARAPSFT